MILHLPLGSPPLLVAAADLALVLHIAGGVIGIAAGMAALVLRKGGRGHRWAGKVFFVCMLIMGSIGAAVSPMIHQPMNAFGGLLVIYLVVTGRLAVNRKAGEIGRTEVALMFVPLAIATVLLAAGLAALYGADVLPDGVPIQAPFVMASVAALAACADLNLILRRGLRGAQRMARHLWRLNGALLFASFSLFVGQPKVFPPGLRGSPILLLPEIFVIGMMVYWLIRVRASRPRAQVRPPEPVTA